MIIIAEAPRNIAFLTLKNTKYNTYQRPSYLKIGELKCAQKYFFVSLLVGIILQIYRALFH